MNVFEAPVNKKIVSKSGGIYLRSTLNLKQNKKITLEQANKLYQGWKKRFPIEGMIIRGQLSDGNFISLKGYYDHLDSLYYDDNDYYKITGNSTRTNKVYDIVQLVIQYKKK